MRRFIFFLLMLSFLPANAEIYKRVDEKGNIYYSDKEMDGAEQVELSKGNTFTPVETTTAPSSSNGKNEKKETAAYTNISIVKPFLNETIRDNNGNVPVAIELTPALRPDNRIALFMDDKELLKDQTQTTFALNNIDRGSHTLRATVVDKTGAALISSKSVIFHLHRAIIKKKQDSAQDNKKPAEQDAKRNYNLESTDSNNAAE